MPGEPTAEEELLASRAHRAMAIDANSATWELLDGKSSPQEFTPDEFDEVLARAYAAAYHWARAFESGPTNAARAAWLLSRTHAVLGHGELSLHHADRCARIVNAAGLGDFDLGYSHEARARALACLGRFDEASTERELAETTEVADPEDREIYEADLAAAPWFGLTDSGVRED
jgi:hypothetical protein